MNNPQACVNVYLEHEVIYSKWVEPSFQQPWHSHIPTCSITTNAWQLVTRSDLKQEKASDTKVSWKAEVSRVPEGL